MKTIEVDAFVGWSSLNTVTIGSGMTSIGSGAFFGCKALGEAGGSVTLNSNPFIDEDAFKIDHKGTLPVTVTMNLTGNEGAPGEYWMTFYNSTYNFKADGNTEVFKVTLDDVNDNLTMHKVYDVDNGGIVDAGTPVVLKKTGNNGKLVMTKTDLSSGDGQTNSLQGTPTEINTNGVNSYYVQNKGSQGVGFYKLASGGTIGINKAYLGGGATIADAREFFLFEDDDATGIDMPTVKGSVTDAVVYDLQGRRVQNPTKGMYIVNGKKVVIK